MGCHVLDGVYWALKIDHPVSIEAEEIREGTAERYPTGSRIRWDIPAREGLPPVKVFWYEGLKKNVAAQAEGSLHAAKGAAQNFPPLLDEIKKKYPEEEFENSGTLYVGDKGIIYTGCYGDSMHVLPWEKMKQIPEPPKVLPRTKNIMIDFLTACREGKTETAAGFDYGARLTEFTLLANLAQFAGVGKKVVWDGPNMKAVGQPELDHLLKYEYRKGWQV